MEELILQCGNIIAVLQQRAKQGTATEHIQAKSTSQREVERIIEHPWRAYTECRQRVHFQMPACEDHGRLSSSDVPLGLYARMMRTSLGHSSMTIHFGLQVRQISSSQQKTSRK